MGENLAQKKPHGVTGTSQWRRLVRIEHSRADVTAQPGDLPLGQLARREDRAVSKLRRAGNTLEVFPRLSVAYRANRRQVGMQISARAKRFHLVEKAIGKHGVKPLCDARMQSGAIVRQQRQLEYAPGKLCVTSLLQL